ncbi:mRNA interferase MazF [Desulfamplus magnetovallimortis]|uniref:mRNA interferase n=1 Tax=Desulfamplus magnetovallimortis TaxID=1246637 RepID=A0A1W1HGC2_9BACT|nr:type II toxin-antitoxin system PemK/MazF family toxin [Desulfamplus magnetovallimortis]SLM31438.1 mRNA interferase MazF [Desulfamplus magnetovallimortis]
MINFPLRSEIWIVNWNPSRGSEQAGKRPALIIQNNIGNEKAATTIVAAISTPVKNYPMNVILEPPEGGLHERSMVKTSQILTISKERLEKRLGIISSEKMAEVNAAIKLSLDLT